ncbi:enoyl-ACP reductase FabI [Salisediminibacterium halotolerans]|uniref:Enoyl-[acyl-carrier-protein] reductase [NADH] n=1 Tax=Salisediminibacterium halotolerans TaxID=517425 RepID=A0A1H9VDB2_9BACI|nr:MULTISPECIES: enoyl-ACP reductase FabI [Salisediminibacterium]RLJ74432.1 enoyl-[acyl-carrier-protein] reductase [NADH] [Actinophytocola xinjiangensis]RPE87475.1 enoyl-[acyl-carrier-protein] reductase [NADH] [Salisediminibacterium halotolerans]TWG35268.1 enoyl-[acyl-carrier-protein] reductase [NADH] [Salisediminibacterium halotolerans]SES19665.1 enoyl-[acyl-carrier protein] reductase I [Salisediminibacterium haloalkalitolerans]GEL06749.1 enoyl-[acyl-carrier-protein] reductase [NADH] [Salised
MQLDLSNKTYVVMGVANKRSIAWGIAETLDQAGARLIFTYAGERFEKNVKDLVSELPSADKHLVLPCNVSSDEEIADTFAQIGEKVGVIHGIAHCIAFAEKAELEGEFLNATREGFLNAQNISAYSLTAVLKEARPLMTEGGSVITLTYLGGEKVVKNYNTMGVAKASLDASVRYLANDLGKENIRVNAISAGPIRTLSAKGVGGFNDVLQAMEDHAPLKRTVTQEEVGKSAFFLLSDLSSGVTGEILHVDGGYSTIGLM